LYFLTMSRKSWPCFFTAAFNAVRSSGPILLRFFATLICSRRLDSHEVIIRAASFRRSASCLARLSSSIAFVWSRPNSQDSSHGVHPAAMRSTLESMSDQNRTTKSSPSSTSMTATGMPFSLTGRCCTKASSPANSRPLLALSSSHGTGTRFCGHTSRRWSKRQWRFLANNVSTACTQTTPVTGCMRSSM